MTQFLPSNLLALFAARDPIPYLPPVAKLSHEKHTTGYTGVGAYLCNFEDPAETPEPPKVETREERQERKRKEKAEQVAYRLEQEIALWNPNGVVGTTDPYKTLFIGRINYDTSESKLKREFEVYGTLKKIIMVTNKKSGKSRGYAFVEYEHERDMHSAYKHADGKKIDGRRVLVDVERGRTVKGWLPRRLGGGLGGTRRGGPEVNIKISGREDPDRDRFRDDKRERGDRDRDRDRDRERDRRERSKDNKHKESRDRTERVDRRRTSREKDRDRGERVERKRRRSRSRDRKDKDNGNPEEGEEQRPRKRSRSREKKRHRSRSRENKEKKREKRDKDRDREPKDRDKNRFKMNEMDMNQGHGVRVKDEPQDEYPQYGDYDGDYGNSYIKQEHDGEAMPFNY